MNLQAHLDKLNHPVQPNGNIVEITPGNEFGLSDEYFELKADIHDRLTKVVDLSLLDSVDEKVLREEIRNRTQEILTDGSVKVMPINSKEHECLLQEIEDEVLGLGPLEALMKDPTVSDILVNAYHSVYVERFGKIERTKIRFKDNKHLMRIIEKIVSAVGRRIDEISPMVDARLADGSRVNVIIPPLALNGPCMSIRRFSVDPLEMHDLQVLKTITPALGKLLEGIVQARLNVLISGGTGSGKTTLLNVMSRFISSAERTVTIEDSAELQLRQEHVIRLETRPANVEGAGQITQRNLVRNSLRMRPDRIIVGEVRGAEAIDMLQAMNTGHEGSLTTVHANNPADALMRIETMVNMAGFNLHSDYIKRYISSAINVVIQVDRLVDGSRKVVSLSEITGMEGNVISMQEIIAFEQTGIDQVGGVSGHFEVRGVRPKFFDKFTQMGVPLTEELFDENETPFDED
ncbi:CpaF family protein [Desulfotalea psychrophila]|uniref:Probable secretory protein kinase n=1 Tax=Desulfotalea psychrophila (strain LSv54 / DSM 12343) TaxID=177439 RepID=Q6AN15_DESPS|nr:CpaF family protein [Desulfotalea psychrophila]CAG36259.1 probable secretory protein kinase [Desulfotalea psychrophila LSv54]